MLRRVSGTVSRVLRAVHRGHPRRAALVLGGVLLLVGLGYRVWYGRTHQTTDDAQLAGHVIPILPRVGGYVVRVHVADDALVRAGDTLLTLDARDLEEAWRAAAAAWRAAVAVGPAGAAGDAQAEARAQVAVLEAGVGRAVADSQYAAVSLARLARLTREDLVPRQQLDGAVTALRDAVAAVQAARSQLVGARASLIRANAEAGAAASHAAALRAALDAAALQRGYATIVAPVSGRVARRSVEPGQLVAPGQAVMAVVRRDSLWVVANLQETQMRRVRPGLLACVHLDAFPEHTLRGHVTSVQQATGAIFSLLPPDNATGSFTKVVQRIPVRIALDRRGFGAHELSPGLSATVVIDTRPARATGPCDDERRPHREEGGRDRDAERDAERDAGARR